MMMLHASSPCLFVVLALLTTVVTAYVPTMGRAPRSLPPQDYPNRGSSSSVDNPTTTPAAVVTTAPWRIALNIGNQPGYVSSTSWPIVVRCDFSDAKNVVQPQADVIRYTTRTGEVVKPIQAGTWSLDAACRNLAFTLSFPEAMARNDLSIKAGTTLTCSGAVYTSSDIKDLNANFYQARDEAWDVGAELNAMMKEKEGPKQWNEQAQAWEKRSGFAPLAYLQTRVTHARLLQQQNRENDKRPNPQSLSAYPGRFPGLPTSTDLLFIGKQGVIKQGTQVIGTWAAEPMVEDRPVSYMNQ
jgi:hypothetical protein